MFGVSERRVRPHTEDQVAREIVTNKGHEQRDDTADQCHKAFIDSCGARRGRIEERVSAAHLHAFKGGKLSLREVQCAGKERAIAGRCDERSDTGRQPAQDLLRRLKRTTPRVVIFNGALMLQEPARQLLLRGL